MKYRTLGRTGLRVSEVGFGGAGIGHVWGETTDAACVSAVRGAVELGVNFFDTSPMRVKRGSLSAGFTSALRRARGEFETTYANNDLTMLA